MIQGRGLKDAFSSMISEKIDPNAKWKKTRGKKPRKTVEKKHYKARDGGSVGAKKKSGKSDVDKVLQIIFDNPSGISIQDIEYSTSRWGHPTHHPGIKVGEKTPVFAEVIKNKNVRYCNGKFSYVAEFWTTVKDVPTDGDSLIEFLKNIHPSTVKSTDLKDLFPGIETEVNRFVEMKEIDVIDPSKTRALFRTSKCQWILWIPHDKRANNDIAMKYYSEERHEFGRGRFCFTKGATGTCKRCNSTDKWIEEKMNICRSCEDDVSVEERRMGMMVKKRKKHTRGKR
jgi:hypothetical protein